MNVTKPVPELLIVMPVFNEEASVRKVMVEWVAEVRNWTENFVFLAIDDGSTDGTPRILERLRGQLGSELELVHQPNQGHGQSCLNGYRIAVERKIPFVFQIDSDGQCDPQYFFRFWRQRATADVVYGQRVRRDDGIKRRIASLVLKWTLLAAERVWCIDANVPYRLMRTAAVEREVARIPKETVLVNIVLSVLLKRSAGVRHASVPIRFRERYGGEPSVPIGKFGARAIELIRQLRAVG